MKLKIGKFYKTKSSSISVLAKLNTLTFGKHSLFVEFYDHMDTKKIPHIKYFPETDFSTVEEISFEEYCEMNKIKKNAYVRDSVGHPYCPDCGEQMVKSFTECDDGSDWYCGWLCGCKLPTNIIKSE